MLLERRWDREPMPSCHEWDLAGCVLFQVLDSAEHWRKVVVTLHVTDLKREVERQRGEGIDAPGPVKIEGFNELWHCRSEDPEGNELGLLEGA